MFKNWWKLPSTTKFLNSVVNDIKNGKNTILWFPEVIDPGYIRELCDFIRSHNCYSLVKLNPLDKKPIDYLCEYFKIQTVTSEDRSLKKLLTNNALEGKILLIQPNPNLIEWLEFALKCQHELQDIEPISRCLLILPIAGISNNTLPKPDICLSVKIYLKIIQDVDLELFYNAMIDDLNWKNELLKKTYISILNQISNDDFQFSKHLLNQSQEKIFDPFEIMVEYAQSKNWGSYGYKDLKDLKNEELDFFYMKGIINFRNNQPSYHSAFLALHNRRSDIEQRIWTAQVKVLFPFVEIYRHRLLKKLNGVLTFPYLKKIGTGETIINNASDLEIGDIKFQITSRSNGVKQIGKEMFNCICVLKEIRDKMSHIQVVSYAYMNNDIFSRIDEIFDYKD